MHVFRQKSCARRHLIHCHCGFRFVVGVYRAAARMWLICDVFSVDLTPQRWKYNSGFHFRRHGSRSAHPEGRRR
jgi:hypothetical protein